MYDSRTFQDWLRQATDAQLVRLACRLFARCCDAYGVSSFDWPTLAALYPDAYTLIRACRREWWNRATIVIPDPCELEV